MVARVGTLAAGTRFETTLTGRGGRVLIQSPEETTVEFSDTINLIRLHPDVQVLVDHPADYPACVEHGCRFHPWVN